MKQRFITILACLFLSINFLFAAEPDKDNINKNENTKVAYEQQTENVLVEAQKFVKSEKKSSIKRIIKKRSKRVMEKLGIDNLLNSQRKGLALFIIGLLILLPGMILSMVGVALIPAIIFAIVGGTLAIIGILRMRH